MSGALLQIVAHGHEDVLVYEDDNPHRPFRQVVRRTTPFSRQLVDTQLRAPTKRIYNQVVRGNIPRKGDVLSKIVLMLRVKRGGHFFQYVDDFKGEVQRDTSVVDKTSIFPGYQLVKQASIAAGKQTLETISGEYCLVRHYMDDDAAKSVAVRNLVDFTDDDPAGGYKWLYVELPFFLQKTPFPLIALQHQQLHLYLEFAGCPICIDPSEEPELRIMAEFVYLDDAERLWLTQRDHNLVVERALIQVDPLLTEQTQFRRRYATDDLGGAPNRTVGEASNVQANIESTGELLLVNPGEYTGQTYAFWDYQFPNVSDIDIDATFSLPVEGTVGVKWNVPRADSAKGYAIKFSVVARKLEMHVSRHGEPMCVIKSQYVWTSERTHVRGESSRTDLGMHADALHVRVVHDQMGLGPIDVAFDVTRQGTTVFSHTYLIFENVVPNQVPLAGSVGAFADAQFEVTARFNAVVKSYEQLPPNNNYTLTTQQLFMLRGPIRYICWFFRKQQQSGFGYFSTAYDPFMQNATTYDLMAEATVLLNGNQRLEISPASFFSVYEPSRVLGKPFPAGLHLLSFSDDPTTLQPNGTMNASAITNVSLLQRLKRIHPTATHVNELDESEIFANAADFTQLVSIAVQYNLMRITAGTVGLGFH